VSRGSFGTVVRDVSVGGRREGLSATLGAARRSSDGLHPFNSGWWNEALRARVSGSLAGVAVQASALQHRDTQHFPTTGSGAVVDRNAVRSGRRSTISLDASRSVGSRVRVVAGLASLEGRGRTLDGPDGPADTVGLFAYRNASSVRRRVADTHAEVLVGSRLLATLGAEWSEEAQRSRDSSNYGGTPAFAARRTTRALYVQTAGGTSRLQTVLGARHDDNSAFGSFSTARGGAAYQLTSSVQLRANVGTAFKAPAMLEQFNTAFTVGNPDLSPERSRVLEVAIAHQRRRSSWSATWFAQRFTNLIQYAYQESGPNYFNVARASSQGLETEGTLAATRGVTLQGGATWLKTRVLDAGVDEGVAGATFVRGQRLLRRPNRTATLGVAINRWQPIDVRTDLMYVGTRDDRDFGSFPAVAVRLDPWVRWDASAQYHLRSGIAVLLRGENLLGERYQEVFGFAAPGRALTVGLTVTSKR
jgi:vitamin B12 transporter